MEKTNLIIAVGATPRFLFDNHIVRSTFRIDVIIVMATGSLIFALTLPAAIAITVGVYTRVPCQFV